MRHSVWCALLAAFLLCMSLMPVRAEEAQPTAEPVTTLSYAGYACVTCGTEYRWFPLPLEGEEEYERTVQQVAADGTVLYNTIHFTHEGVYMASANCENQDCVEEGIVTLTNKDTRVLGSWIICQPHQVSVELFTAEELMALINQSQE